MSKNRSTKTKISTVSIGLDLGDKKSQLFALKSNGEVVLEAKIATTPQGIATALDEFREYQGRVIVIFEAGTHSRWVDELIEEELGFETIVANPRTIALVNKAKRRKNDRLDAQALAHWGLQDPYFLSPIKHRGSAAQADLCVIRAREALVESRTKLINHVRSTLKQFAIRPPSSDSRTFHKKIAELVPDRLKQALDPLLANLEWLTREIAEFEKKIDAIARTKYPEAERLRQVAGVGPIVSLAFILTLEDPKKFRKSRQVGAFLGLIPALWESGDRSLELRITKSGDENLRRLLLQSAHYILGAFGPDSDLRRFGERIFLRGGRFAKKRAATAVARKLAVLLHSLWVSGEDYEPLRNSKAAA